MVTDIVEYRLSVLEMAESLGNVTEACRRMGMNRSRFYAYRKRYQDMGINGLRNQLPIHKYHPMTTPKNVENRVISLSEEHPAWGCVRINKELGKEGHSVSCPTIQKILVKKGLAIRNDRWTRLERKVKYHGFVPTKEQSEFIIKENPAFKERGLENVFWPGEVLIQETILLSKTTGLKRIYAHLIVDAKSSYAFVALEHGKSAEVAAKLLAEQALPFFKGKGFAAHKIITGSGKEFVGDLKHPYTALLRSKLIEHKKLNLRRQIRNGHMEYFYRALNSECIMPYLKDGEKSFELLGKECREWLNYYNNERANNGYPNYGRTPAEVVEKNLQRQPTSMLLLEGYSGF